MLKGTRTLKINSSKPQRQDSQKKQFKNKWDMLKKEYTQFMELKLAATGLGWDDQSRTIEADDNWWEMHLKVRLFVIYINLLH